MTNEEVKRWQLINKKPPVGKRISVWPVWWFRINESVKLFIHYKAKRND